MIERDNTPALSWIVSDFALRLAQVIESMTGKKRPIPHRPATAEEVTALSGAGTLWWKQGLKGLPEVVILTAATQTTWFSVGKEILEGAGVEAHSDDAASTFTETLGQAFGAFCQSLSVKLQREVTSAGTVKAEPDPAGTWHSFSFADDKSVLVRFGDPLIAALQPPALPSPKLPIQSQLQTTATRNSSLDLLFDVEMPVSVSFGRAELPLKDVLKLTSGSIVELNRSVAEPVEIIVNNCVIARGEVVVIEGNYGVRITQIISRQERLRTLR